MLYWSVSVVIQLSTQIALVSDSDWDRMSSSTPRRRSIVSFAARTREVGGGIELVICVLCAMSICVLGHIEVNARLVGISGT